MWELYALWAWAGAYLQASYALRPGGTEAALGAKLLTFATVAIGGLGALGGGWLADRIGRTRLTALAMLISGSCALLAGPLFGGPPLLVAALFLLWGLTVVADSAQFSACILELAPRELQGTLVTIQTSVGFLITVGSIHLVARIQDSTGWVWAFTALAPGPLLGAVAMLRLRGHPEAKKIAGGLG